MTDLEGSDLDGRYRLLVDAITDYAIYMLDPQGRVNSWSMGAKRLKGYEEDEILGEHFSRFCTPEDRASGVPATALETAATTGRFEAEGFRLRKNGERFPAHVVIDAIRDSRGLLLGFAKITRDLSERKKAEQILRRQEELFRMLIQGVTDYAIYLLDPDGLVSSWNAGAQRIKGFLPDEIIGQHFSRFYTDEDKAAGLPSIALETAAREGRFEKEGWRIRKDGSRFWANVIIDAIHADDGSLVGFAKITRDITEKRQAEEALARAQQELFQAQKMEAVGQLTGGVAHDFNNLLMAILGSLEIARKRTLAGEGVLDLIDNAIVGARRGASLTQRLLAFSRKQDLKLKPVKVADLVSGMTELMERSIGPAIEIVSRFEPDLPAVLSDANQLENALLNLVVNARDAMPDGGTITISAGRHRLTGTNSQGLPSGHYVCLSVTDEGGGMDDETLELATTPFFTTKGIGKGTGLGLPMVQGLMAQAGGALHLKSAPGLGCTAQLWLPVAADQTEPASHLPSEPLVQSPSQLTVLAVDDDALVLMNTILMLEDLGHEAIQAESAGQVLELLKEGFIPDVILTDHAMPNMTGAELIRTVSLSHPSVALVLATGYAELPDGTAPRVVKLSKPFTQAQLSVALAAARPAAPA
ncbi:PAS domain S-box protein [Rhizobium sp. 21-4511-3d]